MTVDQGLRETAGGAARGEVRFPADFHGFPGVVHGGAVAALFHQLTLPQAPVHLRMDLLRGVPTETSMRLTTTSVGADARLALDQGDRRLAEATLSRATLPPIDTGPILAAWADREAPQGEVPGTRTCLACGSASPRGLGLRFRVTDRLLWCEYTPRESYRLRGRFAHPALATIALDELGWWLGALAQGECGVTTEVAITLARDIPFGPLLVIGDRTVGVVDGDPRGRYSRVGVHLLTPDGESVAAGSVRFAGSRAYTKRLVGPFLETTDRETLARLFPSVRDFHLQSAADVAKMPTRGRTG